MAAPFPASVAAGELVEVEHTPSFVVIGVPFLHPEMWALARDLLDGALVSTLEEISASTRLLAERNSVVAQGAGAAPVAAALSGQAGSGKGACVVSGGNIDAGKLAGILDGEVPPP